MTKGSERNYILKILEDIDKKDLFVNQIIDDYFYVYDFDKQQRSFISKVVYGVVEQRIYIDFVLNQFSKVRVNKMKPVIRHLMRMSVYQILFMDKVPDHAAINESVKLAKKRKFYQLTGFVNGVLRSIVRDKDSIGDRIERLHPKDRMSVKYSFDKELVNYLSKQYTNEVLEEFLKESLKIKGTSIRTNLLKTDRPGLMEALSGEATVTEGNILCDSMYIEDYGIIDDLEAFKKGLFHVQYESSSLVCLLSGVSIEASVLDACAAPGGKTTHLSGLMDNTGSIVSCDVSDHKTGKILENVNRLGLTNVSVRELDAREKRSEFIEAFDLVVADVPCSGLGIIRNKPDIKYNMNPAKIQSLIELQKEIIDNVGQYVKPGGSFMYTTCTINKEENISQVKRFLEDNRDFELVDMKEVLACSQGLKDSELLLSFVEEGCLQLMTSQELTDGFFIAKMIRKKQ